MEAKKDSKMSTLKSSTLALDLLITGIIALVYFLSPLFFTGLVAQGLGFEKMILFYFLVLLAIVAWVTKGVILGELKIKRTPLDIPILATLIAFAVSTILSVNSRDSLIGVYGSPAKSFVALLVFVLFYYLVVNNLNTKRIKIIFWSIVASGGVLAVFSLLQLFEKYLLGGIDLFSFTAVRGFNPLGSLSGLTMYLAAILPVFVVAASQTQVISKLGLVPSSVIKVFIGLASLAAFVVLALLNGFTYWPVALAGMVIVLMFFLSKIIKISNNNLLIPLLAFIVLIILLVIGNFNLVDLKLPAEVSLSRGASWDIAKQGIKDNPIFGSGPSTFYYSFSKFKSPNFNASPLWNVRFDSASGALFELLATVGVFGVLSVIILTLVSLSISFVALVKNKEEGLNSIQLGFFAAFISLVLFALMFSQNNSLILLTVLIAIITVASSVSLYPEKFSEIKLSFRASANYALALAAIFLCVSAGVVVLFTMGLKMYLADIYVKKALLESDVSKKISQLEKATTLIDYQDAYYVNLANNQMAKANQLAIAGNNQNEIAASLAQAIDYGKKAVDLNENKASNNESLALIYENASFYTRGALEWSEQLYSKAAELDPQNPTPSLRIALVNMARANAETDQTEKAYYIGEAIKKYDEAISKKSDLAAAYYGKAIAHEKLNQQDDAIENLKRANLVTRTNLDYRFELGRLYFNRGVANPSLSQTASQQIAENSIDPQGASSTDAFSVQQTQPTGNTINKNSDLQAAEQLFISILASNSNHANAKYSLAVLYQKTGELDKASLMVNSLLETVKDARTSQAIRDQFADIIN